MKKQRILSFLTVVLAAASMFAQRTTDKLDRGVVAVPAYSGGGYFVSWRIFGEEYYDTEYNLYRDGVKLNSEPLKVSNYQDRQGTSRSTYQVAPVVRGVEKERSEAVTAWAQQYLEIPVAAPTDRNGNNASADYALNDVSLADLDGDGISEFIVKRVCYAASNPDQKVKFHQLDCYDYKGNRLWWIDLGPNMLSGADEQWDAVAYDWDGDGKAEVLMRGADNMIIHHADGTTTNIGNMTTDTRWSGIEYTSSGNEYLLYLEGKTAKPYQIGPSAHPDYMVYPLTRGEDKDWGDGIVGHRSTKHFFGAPFLDGRHASIFIGRGIYTKEKMIAYDVDPSTHQLKQRWTWECNVGGPWFGQGYHNYAIADVDWDGRDEIVYGSMIIDDNGKGLSTTGLGHGDAQHCSNFDPYRHGQEQFACNESSPAMNYRNATTSQFYYRAVATGDDGRALCANFSNTYPGSIGRSVTTGWVSSVADKIIEELNGNAFIDWSDLNWRIYWDGDLCDEYLESPGTEKEAVVYKPAGTGNRLLQASGTNLNNSSKNNPCAVGDLWGDWREEIVLRNNTNTALRVYTTNIPTDYPIYTLWHDHQYRNAMVWQSLGYNQPPHKSYFLGEMEGITVAPPPLTMTGRTEVPNDGQITNEDKHFIVCETNNTNVSIAEGASPYIVTFNVPTWIQGTAASNSTSANEPILPTVYTCNVTGGALTGDTRVVKQGDGVLNLPKVNMTHTGETNIWAGVLNFDGTMKNSPLWLNRFAELNTDGGTFKSIRAEYGSVIRPGGEDKKGTLTVDETLDLRFGSRVVIDLYGATLDGDVIKANTISTEKKTSSVWTKYGPQYLQPVIEIKGHGLVAGEYVIAEVENLTGSLTNIKIEGAGDFKSGLTYENGKIILTLGDIRGAGNIVWTGSESSIWDFAKTENFAIAGDDGTPDVFVKGDVVEFNDDAQRFTVTIEDDIPADSVIVNASKNYTISGKGVITEGALVKKGSGTLTISTDNTYKGGNYLSGGKVSVSSLSNSVQSYGNLGGVTTSTNNFVMENGAILQTTSGVTNGSPIRFASAEGGVIDNSADFNQQATLSGTLLTKQGGGWLKTSTPGSGLTRLVIAGGTVQSGSGYAAQTVEFRNGSLVDLQGTNNALYVPEGGTGSWTTATDVSYGNRITGDGTLTIYCASRSGTGWVATRTRLQLNLSGFNGTLIPRASNAADGRFTLDTSNGMPNGTMNIPAGVYVQNTGKTFAIGRLDGEGALAGFSSFENNGATGTNTWQIGNDENWTWKGTVTDNSIVTKVGSGKITVNGAWTNSGAVNVNEGGLHLGNTASLGTGALTVAAGATLTGRPSNDLSNSSVNIRGTLQVGSTEMSTTGAFGFGNKNVTFAKGSVLRLGIARGATASNTGGTSIRNINRLTMNGTVSLYYSNSVSLAVGDSVVLWTATTTVSGTPELESEVIDATKGLYWDTTDLVRGVLRVTDKAPSSVSLAAADTEVQVRVVSASGLVSDIFTCQYGQVERKFRNLSLAHGVYMLYITAGDKQEVLKLRK